MYAYAKPLCTVTGIVRKAGGFSFCEYKDQYFQSCFDIQVSSVRKNVNSVSKEGSGKSITPTNTLRFPLFEFFSTQLLFSRRFDVADLAPWKPGIIIESFSVAQSF